MDTESVNWCRFAQTVMHKGGEVLRQFLLLEILTMTFTNYTRFWMRKIGNPAENDYLAIIWNNLSGTLKRSQNPSDKVLNELLKSWSLVLCHQIPMMEQIDRLKQWKNDIEKEREKYVSSSVSITLELWLSEIDHEMQKLKSICTVLNQWNDTFHCHLQNAQSNLLLEIETNDGFLTDCIQKLKSLSKPSSREFQQLVQTFQANINDWKEKCCDVLLKFRETCHKIINVWLQEAPVATTNYAMVKFLNRFKTEVDNWNLQSHIELFCGKWYDDLHDLFNRYEKQIHKGDSTEPILNLAQSLCWELEKVPSFKEKKIRDFFSVFNPPEFPRQLNIQTSKLKDISRSSDLDDYDITVLIAVWKNGNFVHSPQNRNKDSYNWDKSISADILRLREHRNTIVDHIPELRIPSETFEHRRKQLAVLLCKIASRCGYQLNMEISRNEYLLKPYSVYLFQKECLTWCRNDILAQLSEGTAAGYQCLDMLQSIQTALENLVRNRKACTYHYCNEEFFTERELEYHMRTHRAVLSTTQSYSSGSSSFHHGQVQRCPLCRNVWEWEHARYHLDHRCVICNIMISDEFCLDTHMMSNHLAKATCLSCRKDFSKTDEHEQHMMCHQARTCRICQKDFVTENELHKHMKDHKARTCRSCNKDFVRGSVLDSHLRDHQARSCCRCKHEFATYEELTEHERNRTDCPKGSIGFLASVFRE